MNAARAPFTRSRSIARSRPWRATCQAPSKESGTPTSRATTLPVPAGKIATRGIATGSTVSSWTRSRSVPSPPKVQDSAKRSGFAATRSRASPRRVTRTAATPCPARRERASSAQRSARPRPELGLATSRISAAGASPMGTRKCRDRHPAPGTRQPGIALFVRRAALPSVGYGSPAMFGRRVVASLSFLLASAAGLPAQGPGLKSVIDEELSELSRRQQPDGSYQDEHVTTSEAVLAFLESPRRYAETDGPFLRRAVQWLAANVDAEGKPAGIAELDEQVAAAAWMQVALARSKSAEAKAALERVRKFLDSDAVKNRPAGKVSEAEFRRTYVLPAKDAAAADLALQPITSVLASTPELDKAEWNRWLLTMPAICADLAARFPGLKLQTTTGDPLHWTSALGGLIVGAMHAPAGFEEASPRQIAAAVRALTICVEKAPPESAAAGSGPPKPTGTPRQPGADLQKSYREAATAGLAWLEQPPKDG